MPLNGFKAFNFNEGVPYLSITDNGITFNKSVTMKLGYPAHVLFLINSDTKQIALQPCAEDVENAVAFSKGKNSKVLSVRWNGKDLLNTLQSLMNWNLSQHGYRADGILLKEDNAMIFDLTQATDLK